MEIQEAIQRARIMRALLENAASTSDYFGRKEHAEVQRNDIAALDALIAAAEGGEADGD